MKSPSSVFTPEDDAALAEVWAAYHRNRTEFDGRIRAVLARAPAVAAVVQGIPLSAEQFARAAGGNWQPLETGLHQLGVRGAEQMVSLASWFELAQSLRRALAPFLSAESQQGLSDLALRALSLISQEYLAALARPAGPMSVDDERQLFECSPLPMWVFDAESLRFLAVNDAAVRHYGFSREEFAQLTLKDIRPPEDLDSLAEDLAHLPRRSDARVWRHRKKSGEEILVEVSAHAFTFQGRPARLVLIKDVTESRRVEEQLRQSQKMDAIGQLAGGVAHDFNNLLTAILSFSRFVREELGAGHPSIADLDEVINAGQRAAALTRQLLAFSRKEMLDPQRLELNEVVENAARMLQRLIGEHIDLVTVLPKDVAPVLVDRSHLEQVILNLAVNARDAMPQGGKLTLESANVELDEVYVRGDLGAPPGAYVMLAVTDTGVGMDKETLARIYEPFFTTKGPGKGTGLGLSTVFGIVKQSGGDIHVYSAPGRGTTFKIYLPRAEGRETVPAPTGPRPAHRGSETLLLVEDDDAVRAIARRTLAGAGYRILEAANPEDAIRQALSATPPVALLVTDVVMPQLSGPELASRLKAQLPQLRTLFMSGYTGGALAHQGVVDAGGRYLQKPFTPDVLLATVRAALSD